MKTFQQFNEDLQAQAQRSAEIRQATLDKASQRVSDYKAKIKAQRDREKEHQEIIKKVKRELQTEQTPVMEPSLYNKMIAMSQISRKRERERHAQREMEREASAQQAQKRREMRAIMSR